MQPTKKKLSGVSRKYYINYISRSSYRYGKRKSESGPQSLRLLSQNAVLFSLGFV